KRAGASSSGANGTERCTLMNYEGKRNELENLLHGLGLAARGNDTHQNQPFRYGNYSIFVAEVASTCNEALLSEYLLNNLESEKERLYILNHFLEGFRGTVFRQTMFAEFEHQIHQLDQQGEPLTA